MKTPFKRLRERYEKLRWTLLRKEGYIVIYIAPGVASCC